MRPPPSTWRVRWRGDTGPGDAEGMARVGGASAPRFPPARRSSIEASAPPPPCWHSETLECGKAKRSSAPTASSTATRPRRAAIRSGVPCSLFPPPCFLRSRLSAHRSRAWPACSRAASRRSVEEPRRSASRPHAAAIRREPGWRGCMLRAALTQCSARGVGRSASRRSFAQRGAGSSRSAAHDLLLHPPAAQPNPAARTSAQGWRHKGLRLLTHLSVSAAVS